MNIVDFLPKYPNINNGKKKLLNPYKTGFSETIFKKREFYEEKLDEIEDLPLEKGQLMKHQKLIARYLSSYTPYNSLLLVHYMGTGKTCSTIGAIEKIKNENNTYKGAYIFAKSQNILSNFINELTTQCTGGQYSAIIEDDLVVKNKLYNEFYKFKINVNNIQKQSTFRIMTNYLKSIPKNKYNDEIDRFFSNHIIVLDEVHNLREEIHKSTNDDSVYEEFHKFLHTVKNCKILLLTGTPIRDKPSEIAGLLNLLLPSNNQFSTGNKFNDEYLIKTKNNIYEMKESKKKDFKKKCKGIVSFLNPVKTNVQKKFIGNTLNHFIVQSIKMSEFQTEVYTNAYNLDITTQKLSGKSSKTEFYTHSRQASLFVFPDKTYGQDNTYFIRKQTKSIKTGKMEWSYSLSSAFIKQLKGKSNSETLINIKRYSCKYAYVIEQILNASNKLCFVYCEFVTGSGAILFSLLLELFTIDNKKFSKATGKEKNENLRYGVLTSDAKNIKKLIELFNNPINKHGQYLKVLIGSKTISEGVTFKNVQEEFILTPWYNYSIIEQTLARGYRYGSHKNLLDNNETPILNIYQLVALPTNKTKSIDKAMYKTAEKKDIISQQILRLLKESSFDCALTYKRNYVKGIDNSRECEFQQCEYKCDNISDTLLNTPLSNDSLDQVTYQLYYTDIRSSLHKKIEELLLKNNNVSSDFIINKLKTSFNENEIMNIIRQIIDKNNRITLFTYNKVYSKFNVIKIKTIIEKLFKTIFVLTGDFILNSPLLQLFTQFEILTVLKYIIDNNIIFKNKYGFVSYLREQHDLYYLVKNVKNDSSVFESYYSENPSLSFYTTYLDVFENLKQKSLLSNIVSLFKLTNEKEFNNMITIFSPQIQEFLIEFAIKFSYTNHKIIKFILSYFAFYIKTLDSNTIISSRLSRMRCFTKNQWTDCNDTFIDTLNKLQQKTLDILKKNPYGFYVKYNPETKEFNIVNVSDKDTPLTKNTQIDKRKLKSGLKCSSWKKPQLLNLILKLKLDYPLDYRNTESLKVLTKQIQSIKKVTLPSTMDDMKRLLYWNEKKINMMCNSLFEWFKKTTYKNIPLLITDNNIGSYGHGKTITEIKNTFYRLDNLIPSKSTHKTDTFDKLLKLLKSANILIDKTTLIKNNDIWYLLYHKKKIISFLVVTSANHISHFFIRRTYVDKKVENDISVGDYLITNIPNYKLLKLNIENNLPKYKVLLTLYQSYGLKILSNDNITTVLTAKF